MLISEQATELAFNPAEHRDAKGRWSTVSGQLDTARRQSAASKAALASRTHNTGWVVVPDMWGRPVTDVTHPDLGHGTVTLRRAGLAHVTFDSGVKRTFDIESPVQNGDDMYDPASFPHPETGMGPGLFRKAYRPDLIDTEGGKSESSAEKTAMAAYVAPGTNEKINNGLRGRISRHNARTAQLDALISRFKTAKAETFYRGITVTPKLQADMKPGATFTDKAFVSTSVSLDWAKNFAQLRATGTDKFGNTAPALGGTPTVMKIEVPAGTHMAPGEAALGEYVLPRGSKFQVGMINPDGTIETTLVPQT
jgi:hypothetical protein